MRSRTSPIGNFGPSQPPEIELEDALEAVGHDFVDFEVMGFEALDVDEDAFPVLECEYVPQGERVAAGLRVLFRDLDLGKKACFPSDKGEAVPEGPGTVQVLTYEVSGSGIQLFKTAENKVTLLCLDEVVEDDAPGDFLVPRT